MSNLLNSGVVDIAASSHAFSALKSNGSVVSWSTTLRPADTSSVSHVLASNVKRIYGCNNYMGFAAIKNDGSLVRWGSSMRGIDNADPRLQEGVVDVILGSYSFDVLKDDESIVTPFVRQIGSEWIRQLR